jgi:hypothetical protein
MGRYVHGGGGALPDLAQVIAQEERDEQVGAGGHREPHGEQLLLVMALTCR